MGVDVPRFGDDASIIRFRQGRDARRIPTIQLRGADTMELAARVADESTRRRVDAIFIDGGDVINKPWTDVLAGSVWLQRPAFVSARNPGNVG